MSFSLGKVVGTSATKFMSSALRLSTCSGAASRVLPASCQRAGAPRSFTRSMWYLASKASDTNVVTRSPAHSRQCGCCGLHTEGDRELAEFLTEEINLEKQAEKIPGQQPKFKGFEVSSDNAEVTITRKADGESLTIKWNVNDTVDDDVAPDFDESKPEEADAPMVSKPMFIVYLNKGGPSSLALQCSFPSEEIVTPVENDDQHLVDSLEIAEVAIVPGMDWDNKIYSVMSSVMDGNLYALLLNMLEDRGINQEFMDELLDFSTTYEHKKYINFLEQLQDFVKK